MGTYFTFTLDYLGCATADTLLWEERRKRKGKVEQKGKGRTENEG